MRWYSVAVVWLSLSGIGSVLAQGTSVPPALEGWQNWVLEGREYVGCPFLDGVQGASSIDSPSETPAARVCAWPGTLELRVDRDVAQFSQRAKLYTRGWLPLPGDAESWPQDVTTDGVRAPVLMHDGRPGVELTPGEYTISGVINWVTRPDVLAIPSAIGLVRLTVDGRAIALPERAGGGVRLGAARTTTEANQLDVQIYRKLTDSLPGI